MPNMVKDETEIKKKQDDWYRAIQISAETDHALSERKKENN